MGVGVSPTTTCKPLRCPILCASLQVKLPTGYREGVGWGGSQCSQYMLRCAAMVLFWLTVTTAYVPCVWPHAQVTDHSAIAGVGSKP
jgi:hypothetical protein